MKKSKSSRKPTGKIGPISMDLKEETAEFQPLKFPKGKAEIEKFIFTFFINGLMNTGNNFYKMVSEPSQNKENNLDFTLHTESGDEYLDLMEVAPLEKVGGSYEAATFSYNHGERADWVWSKLISKSKKYGSVRAAHLHLLLYSTDWRFRLCEGVINLLAYWSIKRGHCFKTIIYFVPDDATYGEAKIIFPCDNDLFNGYDEGAARNRKSLIGNPEKIRNEGNGSFSIPLGNGKPD